MNVYEKLQSARVQLQEKKLKKSGKNKFAGFEYYELSDIIPAINVIFNDLKISSIFKITADTAYLNIINSEKPDEIIEFTTPTAALELKGCNAIQALGGVNTYCRRYLYLNALEIVENDMFDSTSGKDDKNKPPKQDVNEEIDPDFDIIQGLSAINDIKNLEIYFKENDKKVKNKQNWYKAVNNRKDTIGKKEAEEIF